MILIDIDVYRYYIPSPIATQLFQAFPSGDEGIDEPLLLLCHCFYFAIANILTLLFNSKSITLPLLLYSPIARLLLLLVEDIRSYSDPNPS